MNVFRNRIDAGTVISIVPFFGAAVWGVWYSYTDAAWAQNVPLCWGLLGVVVALWVYVIVKCVRRGRG